MRRAMRPPLEVMLAMGSYFDPGEEGCGAWNRSVARVMPLTPGKAKSRSRVPAGNERVVLNEGPLA